MAKCKCWDNVLEKAKKHVVDNLEKRGVEVHGDVDVKLDGYSFFFSGDFSPVNAKVNIEYRPLKKDKTPQKNMKRDQINIFFDFCPFCGRKLGKSEKEAE